MVSGLADTLTLLGQLMSLVLARVIPIVAFSPLFGGEITSRRFRFGLSFLLSAPIALALASNASPVGLLAWGGLIVREVLIGATIAVLLTLMFHAFTIGGGLIDLARGATIANTLDPLSNQQTPVTGVFLLQLGIVLFATLGGFAMVVEAIATSYVLVPALAVDRTVDPIDASILLGVFGTIFESGVRIAAPVIVTMLALDVALALVNRTAPQVQVFFLGLTVKGWLGLAVLMLSVGVLLTIMGTGFRTGVEVLVEWMER